jgi:hypothetical protein
VSTLSAKVALYNIEDCEAFVRHCMKKGRVILDGDAYDELLAEGLVLLYEMAGKYQPHRDPSWHGASTERTKGFYGYALFLLPRKLGDAWHRMNPHHVQRTVEGGRRVYEYHRPAKSLDELAGQHFEGSSGATGNGRRGIDDAGTRWPGNFVAPVATAVV